ncbi:SusC/RagA family TonB-linked outer membrane protein [Mucilaginibacter lacusdianchii]|uniref:SusC/RagA family TonB-linked outer membrane protein n=1 Tax=Mucilaginibacter lacusdianchii TaxID=2684211 RepID=UPI00131AD9CF|nr:SusC/RagA family TonB-linked outer membrane protein [Mucilaginibacter sp. JXJ CY 39]
MKKIYLLILLLPLLTYSAFAQNRTITGTVISADKNEPLIGVSIQVKGGSTGTQTDANGKFSLKVTNLQNVVIGVRYVGYAYQEHTLRVGENNLDVKMQPSAESNLSDVVVVGYGTQKKIHLTGAVASVDTKQIQDIPATDLASTLRGQVPGLNISGGNARPTTNSTTISVRNPIVFPGANNPGPLFIIDDVFRDAAAFNNLDQSEVESISILKDAAAAIYGIQGAYGAIVVRTKRGKSGAPKVTYNGAYGASTAVKIPDVLTGGQMAQFYNDYNATPIIANNQTIDEHGYVSPLTPGGAPTKNLSYFTPDELAYFNNPANNTDWLRYAFKTAVTQRHTLNISGGSDKVTYFASSTYTSQNSNFAGVGNNRWTYRASVDAKVANGLKVALSLSGSINNSKIRYFKQGTESADNDFRTLLTVAPWTQYFINGIAALPSGPQGSTSSNLLQNFNYFQAAQQLNDYSLTKPTVLNINPTISYDVPFVKGLRLTANYNRQITNTFSKQVGTSYTLTQFAGLGENNHIPGGAILNADLKQNNGDLIRFNPAYANDYQLTTTASYSHKFGKHEISLLGLYEQQERYREGIEAYANGVLIGGFDNLNFTNGAQVANQANGAISNFGRQAVAGRLNYNYDDKYLFEGVFRADGNTNFAPGKNWGYFPSFSAGWVVSQEGFFKNNVKFVDFFKIRGSVGFLGADNTKPFQYLENYNFGQTQKAAVFGGNNDRGLAIFQSVALANPNVRWDNANKYNLGLDLQFLKNRLSMSVDGFLDHRYNGLANLTSSTPLVVGANVPTENYAVGDNFGYEISATWRDHIGKDATYYITANFSWSDNKYIKVDQDAGKAGTYLDGINRSSDLGLLGYVYAGFLRTQADVDSWMSSHPGYTLNGIAPKPGMLVYQDVRGLRNAAAPGGYNAPDGKITDADLEYIKPKSSNHYGGAFNFGGTYKGISVQVITTLGWGGASMLEAEALNPIGGVFSANGTIPLQNRPSFWAPGNYWTYSNTNAELPSPYYVGRNGMNDATSDFWLKSSFQFRMTNLNVSYALPKRWASKVGVSDIRIYTNVVNPVNFYNPYGWRDSGTNFLQYPLVKSYTFGLNVGF